MIRHNEMRDITASLLSEVCHGVTIELHLQPLTGEIMQHKSAITDEGARLDVAMYGFGGGGGGEIRKGICGCKDI